MFDVRLLDSADLDQIRRLRLQGMLESPAAFGQTADEFKLMSDAEFSGWIGPNADKFTVGAFSQEGILVGMMGLTRQPRIRTRHKALIWGVYVHPDFRGRGLSRKLLSYLLDHARTLPGVSQVYLSVATSQVAAQGLYRALGFLEFGREPRALSVDGGYIDEVHMYLPLTA